MNKKFPLLGLVIAFAALTLTQATVHADALTTTYAGGAGNEGEMFDVLATRPIRITGVRLAFEDGALTDTVEVYTKTGTHVGSEGTPGDWTLAFSGTVTVSAVDTASPIVSLDTPVKLDSGRRLAIYIRRTSDSDVAYTPGDGTGTVEATDSNLVIFEGVGVDGEFGGATNANRIPNVTIVYNTIKPFLRARGGKTRITTGRSKYVLKGGARYADSIEYKVVGQGGYGKARGNLTRWKAPVNLTSRRTVVRLRGKNAHGRTILRVVVKKQ